MTSTTTLRPRGTGSLYLKNGRWWLKFYANGQPVRESTGTTSRREAERLLRQRLGEIGVGSYVGHDEKRLTFEDLTDMVTADYTLNARRSAGRMGHAIKRLAKSFAGFKALQITAARLTAYAAERRSQDAALATIQYELAVLRRGFSLAVAAGALSRRPVFPSLNVSNAREGFLEPAQVEALAEALPDDLKPILRFAIATGWRRNEILGLTWVRVDFAAGVIRLEAGSTKTNEARQFPIDALPALVAVLKSQRNLAVTLEAATGQPVPLVFHRFGQPIKDFYAAWRAACTRAGVPGRLLHDCRRSAVRNLERAGVSRSVAMKLTGHRTEAVYRRYAIVSEQDLREGVAKLASLGTERAPEAAS